MKLYVDMALASDGRKFRSELEDQLLETDDIEDVAFGNLANGSLYSTSYEDDRRHIKVADLCLFIFERDSIDLGIEMALRSQTGKPMVICALGVAPLSAMLLSLHNKEAAPIYRCIDVDDVMLHVESVLRPIPAEA